MQMVFLWPDCHRQFSIVLFKKMKAVQFLFISMKNNGQMCRIGKNTIANLLIAVWIFLLTGTPGGKTKDGLLSRKQK